MSSDNAPASESTGEGKGKKRYRDRRFDYFLLSRSVLHSAQSHRRIIKHARSESGRRDAFMSSISRPLSPLPANLRHGTGSLVPLDWSFLAVQLMIFAVSNFPLICWLYLATSFWLPESTVVAPLASLLSPGIAQLLHRYVGLPWATLEAIFSMWHAHQVSKLQRAGPKALYSRRFLLRVFSRALKSGLGDISVDPREAAEAAHVQSDLFAGRGRTNSTGLNGLRQRQGHNANSYSAAPHEDDPETWFQQNYMNPGDPRAIKFQQEQARWFWVPEGSNSKQVITRRDASRWLAWSVFNCSLEELEDEHRRLRIATTQAECERAAIQVEDELKTRYSMTRDRLDVDEAEEDPDLKKVLATPNEWVDVARQGTRLDFIHKARRFIEARQGFPYPLTRSGGAGYQEAEAEGSAHDHPITESMRLTLDPVRVQARPLLLYCITQALSTLTLLVAIYPGGFSLHREGRLSYLVKIPAGWSATAAVDPINKGRYRPVIFLHGLGIGLAQYSSLVQSLANSKLATTHPLMIPLQPHISQNIFSPHFLQPIGHHEMVCCLRKAMRKLQWNDCGVQILSHSMGTIVHSWLLKSLGTRVRRSCFVDPVCLRLWIPDVASNFVYLKPLMPVALLMRFFVGQELGTANTLCRHFDWASALLWPEDEIPNLTSRHHTTFFLAGQDAILSCEATRKYLLEYGVSEVQLAETATGSKKRRGGLVVDWQSAHGELLMKDGPGLAEVMNWLEEEDP